jgi:ABC-type transport system involved in cytochrome c biogenesis permease subunit
MTDDQPATDSRHGVDVLDYPRKALRALASLRLTVVLFALSLVLVFYGTLAQMDEGIWTVVEKYFRSFYVMIPLQLNAKFLMVFFNLPKDTVWKGSIPFPAGWTIGFVMLANLLAAHATRFRFTWKRSGILLIHGGFVALMLGELITGLFAVESKMYLQKGESSNFIDDSRNVELAVFTTDAEGKTVETVIPGPILQRLGTIRDDRLPADVEVTEYHKNSGLQTISGGTDEDTLICVLNPPREVAEPNTFPGKRFVVVPEKEEIGVKANREDAPAVRVKIKEKGSDNEVAEFFLSLWQYRNYNQRLVIGRPHTFTADGKTYTIELRNRRIYKPYTVTLNQFEHKVYPGTVVAKDFASTVTLVDQERGGQRDGIRIWMNHPLRYRGETFFQSGVLPDDSGTVLQVVNNPGWILPYVSCTVITLGLLVHFGLMLSTFLRKRMAQLADRAVAPAPARPSRMPELDTAARYLPWAAALLAAVYLGAQAIPPSAKSGQMDLYEFDKIPVQQGGRIKPLDTIARTSLTVISERQEFEDENGKKQPAIRWLIDTMTSGETGLSGPSSKHKVFRIDHDQITDLLKLERRKTHLYSLQEINANRYRTLQKLPDGSKREIERAEAERLYKSGRRNEIVLDDRLKSEVRRIRDIPEDNRDVYDKRLLQLDGHLNLYSEVASHTGPAVVPPLQEGQEQWLPLLALDREAERRAEPALDAIRDALTKHYRVALSKVLKENHIDIEKGTEEQRLEALRNALLLLPEKQQQIAKDMTSERVLGDAALSAAKFEEVVALQRQGDVSAFLPAAAEYSAELKGSPVARALFENVVEAGHSGDTPAFDAAAARYRSEVLNNLSPAAARFGTILARRGQWDDEDAFESASAEYTREVLAEVSPAAAKFHEILDRYRQGDSAAFNAAVKEYREKYLTNVPASEVRTAAFEAYFNHFAPFWYCSMLYLVIIVIGCASWLGFAEPLRRSAFAVTLVTFVVHSFAILARMYIQGRPPVTNLYSSAVFIGWGCVVLCLVLEYLFRNGIGNVIGAALGAATMMIAHKLAEQGDTLEMLQAVLDTDFWLATHVVCVTLGYTTTFVSGFIGILYVLRGVFTTSLDERADRTMGQMLYGVVCFAMALSFVGTVLGGIWGDQSWGRFWGWDPKENGAVLVVIANALILHARWCGLVKRRGMAVLCIGSVIVTFWSWFGTNQLGVGLHAYGFSKELADICKYTWLGLLALIGVGLLPKQYWRSFSEEAQRRQAAADRDRPRPPRQPSRADTTR